jgi:YD repeat-containing protein
MSINIDNYAVVLYVTRCKAQKFSLDDLNQDGFEDAVNRLKSVTQGTHLYSYAYNGLGDRLSQTSNSVTTNYTLDLNAGLTQVLGDGTNTYLYGMNRISQ